MSLDVFMKKTKITPWHNILLSLIVLSLSQTAYAVDLSDFSTSPFLDEPTKTISMDFKGAALNDVLKIFSQQSGMNFIADQQIAGKTLNLYLDKVPVEEALERILSANNLTYEIKPGSNIFVVKTMPARTTEVITRVYALKQATLPSSKIKSQLSFSSDSSGSSSGGTSGQKEKTASTGIVAAIEALLTADGKIIEDTRTNSLIITDIPAVFPSIEQTIARLDVRIPQILIEVEMLDVSKSTVDLMGAKFGSTFFSLDHGATKQGVFPFDAKNTLHGYDSLPGDPAIDGKQYTSSLISFQNLNVVLQFLRTQTDTNNLARPRILTLNNETAMIDITTDEVTGVTLQTSAVGNANSQQQATAERHSTGVTLKVTPQANLATKEIVLAVEPKVIQARQSSGVTGAEAFKDIETRKTESMVRLRDGDTLVLGGLLRNDTRDVRTKVPFISDIPIIGAGFRHKDKSVTQRELLIFLTPHILDETLAAANTNTNVSALIREQDTPSAKLKEIDRDLTQAQTQRR